MSDYYLALVDTSADATNADARAERLLKGLRLLCLLLIPFCFSLSAAETASAQTWTQFETNRRDARGRYLWTEAKNWNRGLPDRGLSVEIGDDHSGKALHCVIATGTDAVCSQLELAEHARTQGTTLRLEKDARLTVAESAVLSKDRESRFYVDGTLRCRKAGAGLRVGGPWGRPDLDEPARCRMVIGPTGIVDAWFVGINTTHRADSAPSTPWGPRFFARSTGSEIVLNGGKLIARRGLRMSTCLADRPGALRLRGKATLSMEPDAEIGFDLWCGVWEIDGGRVEINIGDLEFWGNKFRRATNAKTGQPVGAGLAVLKLTGNGVSTIHARAVDFVDAAVLDVSGLTAPAGTYTVIDGKSLKQKALRFAAGTDTDRWSFRFDEARADLLLERTP